MLQFLLPRLALLVTSLIAAGTFLVAKDTLRHFSGVELGCLRILLSFVIILPIYLGSGQRPRPRRGDLPRLLALGICGITANQMLFLHGIHLAPVLDGALLYALTPAMVLIAAVLWLGERASALKVTGVGVALVGVVVVLSPHGLSLQSTSLRGDLYLFCAVLAWSAYTLLGKPILRRYPPLTVITWSFGFGAATVLPLAPGVLLHLDYRSPGVGGWLGLVYLSAVTSGVAFTLWYWALQRLQASEVAVFTNLQPPLTAALEWACYGSLPGWQTAVGGVLVLGGVALAQRTAPAALDRANRSDHNGRRPPVVPLQHHGDPPQPERNTTDD